MKEFKIPKNWKTITIESANFILNESKEYISYTINESEKLTKRAYSLMILLITILSAIVGYTYKKIVLHEITELVYLNFCFTLIIAIILFGLSILIFPRKIYPRGRKPSEFSNENLLNSELTSEETNLSFVLQEIVNSQKKIRFNLFVNQKRTALLKIIMISVLVLFPVYLILTLIITS
jgi:hypothetical protein